MASAGSGVVTVRVENIRQTLAALGRLPKELNRELRVASKQIATDVMVPAWQRAAQGAGAYGPLIAVSIRARSDRQPAVVIGKRSPKLRGGIDSIMARYPSDSGNPSDGTFDYRKRPPLTLTTFHHGTGWMQATGAHEYGAEATRRWGDALEDVLARWNAGVG